MVIKLETVQIKIPTDVSNHVEIIAFKKPDRYSEIEYIGSGSFGCVVSGKDLVKNQDVVIKKVLILKDKQIRSILREIIILRKSCNPHIAQQMMVYMDVKKDSIPTSVYIVMESCGINLRDYISDKPEVISLKEAAVILYSITKGLNFLHKLEIYHRDLKPANICIDMSGCFPAKIIDLGLARVKPKESNELTRQIATVCYRAPENLIGVKYDKKLDVWSLGCIFGFMLTSQHTFLLPIKEDGRTQDTMQRCFEVLGTPPQTFIELVDENVLGIDKKMLTVFRGMLKKMPEQESNLESLFADISHDEEDSKKGEAVQLIKGMLKWDYKDRFTTEDVLSSTFIADIRNEALEVLPDPQTQSDVKENLRAHEEKISELEKSTDKSTLLKDYLFNFICDYFGKYGDSDDYFPYASPTLNRLIQTLKHLQTGTVLMTIAAVGATFVSERLDYRPAKIVVTGTAFLVALSAVNYAIQRYF